MTTTATAPSGGHVSPRDTTTTITTTPRGPYATYVPHDLNYSADFEDSLIHAVLESPTTTENQPPPAAGIRVIPDDSDEPAVPGESIRNADIDPHTLPTIREDELPLPLDDARRVFASPVPGVKLTHPGGYLEGGPGLEPDMDTFPDDFISARQAQIVGGGGSGAAAAGLRRALAEEIAERMEVLRERLRARRKARERNEQIERELKALKDQHSMELRIHNRMQEEVARKKEAREKRRKEREGG